MGSRLTDLEPFRLRNLANILGGQPGVQGDRRKDHSSRHQSRNQVGTERPACARHFRAARAEREDRLVGRDRE